MGDLGGGGLARISYGGQAVIEGVMMRGPTRLAIAVRRPDGQIAVHRERSVPWARRHRLLGLPVIRGVVALAETLAIGIAALMYSANQSSGQDRPLSRTEMAGTVAVGVGLAVLVFIVVPTAAIGLIRRALGPVLLANLLEGLLRVALLIGYVSLISRLSDIQRVLQYHGAEHKVIWTYERGEPLTVEHARRQSKLHPRCGTSFLFFVVVVSALLFSFLGWAGVLARILARLALLPLVAGLSYEILKYTGASGAAWLRPFVLPGLWLQTFTTREPDDSMLEVALASFQAVLDEPPSPAAAEAAAGAALAGGVQA